MDVIFHAKVIVPVFMESEARRLEIGIYQVHLQPIVAATGRPSGKKGCSFEAVAYETLIRERGGNGCISTPTRMLDLALKDDEMAHALLLWNTRAACQIAQNPKLANSRTGVSFNVTERQLALPNCTPLIFGQCAEYSLDPGRLIIEVSEKTDLNQGHIMRQLRDLSDGGFTLALDDYGTAKAGFEDLQCSPFAIIKIDKSKVAALREAWGRDRTMINAEIGEMVLWLSNMRTMKLPFNIIAEGIEPGDEEVIAELLELGVAMFQGWKFGKPQPPEYYFQ